eukprot:scaffold5329_cov126-Skeletonema_marinoi.AAC.4
MDDAAHNNDEIFVYTGGDQVVPSDVRRVRIDKSVKIIPRRAFEFRRRLIYVEFHDGIEIIGEMAFGSCTSLRSVKLLGVKIVKAEAFNNCTELMDVDGNKLETIEDGAFKYCTSLRTIKMPCVRNIRNYAFGRCRQLTDLDLPDGLETIEQSAFQYCQYLKRIAIPLGCMIAYNIFCSCPKLTTINLVGGIHNTIASLHLESWRNEMKGEINRINQVLPTSTGGKTAVIQQWMNSVIRRLNHCKAEHKAMLKEATTLLELALWKAKIGEKEEILGEVKAKRVKMDIQSERNERRVTSGANIVIKNVLPFLELV